MLVRPVILDDCVPDSERYLPKSGVILDGPGSANDCGAGSGKPFLRYEGCCQNGTCGTPLRTDMRGLPVSTKLGYEYLIVTMIWIRGMKYIGRG